MFVRVRDFGAANQTLFPESSTAGKALAQVAASAAEVEQYLMERTLARTEARRVKTDTRRAVTSSMKVIATTGKRVAATETTRHPFLMPRRRSATVVLATARHFITEAERRAASFVELGMPPTFVEDFRKKVDALEGAIAVKQNSRGLRQRADKGIEAALDRGFDNIETLDVAVANILREDPVRYAHWEGARHVARPHDSSSPAVTTPAEAPVAPKAAALEPLLEQAS
jgi:hypothetical protein